MKQLSKYAINLREYIKDKVGYETWSIDELRNVLHLEGSYPDGSNVVTRFRKAYNELIDGGVLAGGSSYKLIRKRHNAVRGPGAEIQRVEMNIVRPADGAPKDNSEWVKKFNEKKEAGKKKTFRYTDVPEQTFFGTSYGTTVVKKPVVKKEEKKEDESVTSVWCITKGDTIVHTWRMMKWQDKYPVDYDYQMQLSEAIRKIDKYVLSTIGPRLDNALRIEGFALSHRESVLRGVFMEYKLLVNNIDSPRLMAALLMHAYQIRTTMYLLANIDKP